ncbi:MAG: hypothetical protein EOP09_09775 [Proteobacteria bacterium]|nr:MAG: hypothetical protein EOP09_09775 [Pseudomonadota bacterium]
MFPLTLTASLILAAITPTKASAAQTAYRPFGELSPLRIGNLPHSPNFTALGPLMHFMAVDLFQDAGTSVYALQSGRLSRPHLPRTEDWTTSLQILAPDGLFSYYVHLDPKRIPETILKDLSNRGFSQVNAGDKIGELIQAPGSLSSHLHFGTADCKRRVRLHPLQFLSLPDQVPPVIDEIELSQDGKTVVFDTISGDLDLTVLSYDQWDENSTRYPPNRIEFRLKRITHAVQDQAETVFERVLFDLTEIPFRDRTRIGQEPASDCGNLQEIDSYADQGELSLYRRVSPGASNFAFALTRPALYANFPVAQWIQPLPERLDTARCFETGNKKGQRVTPDGLYELEVQVLDLQKNSAKKSRRFRIKNARCSHSA